MVILLSCDRSPHHAYVLPLLPPIMAVTNSCSDRISGNDVLLGVVPCSE
jgi:hypothetical protein